LFQKIDAGASGLIVTITTDEKNRSVCPFSAQATPRQAQSILLAARCPERDLPL
jgi:hypothetical protein